MTPDDQNQIQKGEQLSLVQTIDDWLGPTLAIVESTASRSRLLINLVAWQGTQLKNRIYGARHLTTEATDTYLRNINRDYCDLTRKSSETDALIGTTTQQAQLIQIGLPDLTVTAVSANATEAPFRDWQDISPDEFTDWQQLLH